MGWGRCGHCSDDVLHSENRREGDFWAAKLKNEPCRLDFDPGCANLSAGCRVGIWGGVGVAIAVMACCIWKIARVVAFGLQNQKNEPCTHDFGPGCAISSAMGAGYDINVMYTVVGACIGVNT